MHGVLILESLREYAKIKYSNVDAVNQLVADKEKSSISNYDDWLG